DQEDGSGGAVSVPRLETADRVARGAIEQEASAEAAREFIATPLEGVDALAVDELQCATRPRREADAEDRADVGVVCAGQHALGQAARGLHRLPVEQTVLDVAHVPGQLGVLEEALELRPQVLALARRVVVEAGAG